MRAGVCVAASEIVCSTIASVAAAAPAVAAAASVARAPARAYLRVLRRAGRFAGCSTGVASGSPAGGWESIGEACATTATASGWAAAAADWAVAARGVPPLVTPVGRPALRAGAGRARSRLRTRQTTAISTPLPSVSSVRRTPVRLRRDPLTTRLRRRPLRAEPGRPGIGSRERAPIRQTHPPSQAGRGVWTIPYRTDRPERRDLERWGGR